MDKTAKDRMKRYRERNKTVTSVTPTVTEDGEIVTLGVTAYHPIMYVLTDLGKRIKLEKICASLKAHNVLDKVYYGVGIHSLSMDVVGEQWKLRQRLPSEPY